MWRVLCGWGCVEGLCRGGCVEGVVWRNCVEGCVEGCLEGCMVGLCGGFVWRGYVDGLCKGVVWIEGLSGGGCVGGVDVAGIASLIVLGYDDNV